VRKKEEGMNRRGRRGRREKKAEGKRQKAKGKSINSPLPL